MPKTITVYTLEEIKELSQSAYEKIHQEWKDRCSEMANYSDEIMVSLKALFKKLNVRLLDWNIGPYSPSSLSPEFRNWEDDTGESFTIDDLREDLRKLGYNLLPDRGGVYDPTKTFPGICALTGVCYDEDLIQHLWERMFLHGDSFPRALCSLADRVRELMEAEEEYALTTEEMEQVWGDDYFTIDGEKVEIPSTD